MAKTKIHTYQLIQNSYLGTAFIVKNERVGVIFEGGFTLPYRYNGVFSTDNPDLIKVMESDTDYNTIYKRISPLADEVDNTEDKGKELEADKGKATDPPKEDDKPKGKAPEEDLSDYTIVPEVSSCQKAKAWLLAHKPEIKTAMLTNTETTLKVAELYKVRFPDWTPTPAN